MVMTDPVADFLTRVRNGNMVMHETVEVPGSKLKLGIAGIMKDEGYIKDYEYIEDGKQGIIRIYLKYGPNREKVITGLKRISKPGRRVYTKAEELRPVYNNIGIWILSTPKGVITNKAATKLTVGGEVICEIS